MVKSLAISDQTLHELSFQIVHFRTPNLRTVITVLILLLVFQTFQQLRRTWFAQIIIQGSNEV